MKIYLIHIINLLIDIFANHVKKSYCSAHNQNQSQIHPILEYLLINSDTNISSNCKIPEINEKLNCKVLIRKHYLPTL